MKTKLCSLFVLLLSWIAALPRTHGAESLLDPSFRLDPAIGGVIEVVRVRPDGRILVAGELTLTNGARVSLLQLDSHGRIDPGFQIRSTYRVRDLLILPSGELLVMTLEQGSVANPWVETVTTQGTCFRSSADGSSWDVWARFPADCRLERLADGDFLVTGTQTVVYSTGFSTRGFVERRLPDGSLVPSFQLQGVKLRAKGIHMPGQLAIRNVEECRNGDLLFAGLFERDSETDNEMPALVRTRSNGEVIWTVPANRLEFAFEDDQGRITTGGSWGFFRFDSEGRQDLSGFDSSGALHPEGPSLVLSDGRLLAWGWFPSVGPGRRLDLQCLLDDGTRDLRFQTEGSFEPTTPWKTVWSLAEQPDGKLLVAGDLQPLDGAPTPGLIRLFPTNPGAPEVTNVFQMATLGLAYECGEPFAVRVVRRGDTNRTETFRVWTAPVTATSGVDFVPVDLVMQFALGERVKTLPLQILKDSETEAVESLWVNLQFTDPSSSWPEVSPLAINIFDRDCRVSFVEPGISVVEGAAVVYHSQSLVHLSNPSRLPVRVRTVDLTAKAGVDYAPLDGEVVDVVELKTYDNAVTDGDRQFALEFVDSGSGLTLGPPERILVTIRDNDIELGPYRGLSGGVKAIHASTNGSWILTGDFNQADGLSRPGVVRFNALGNVDRGFTPPSALAERIRTVACLPNGKVLVAGNLPSTLDPAGLRMTRLNADGSYDSTFSLSGDWSTEPTCPRFNQISSLLAFPDGGFLVVGSLPRFSDCYRPAEYVWFSAKGAKLGEWTSGGGYGLPVGMQAIGPHSVLIMLDKHVARIDQGGAWRIIHTPSYDPNSGRWPWPKSACALDANTFWVTYGDSIDRYVNQVRLRRVSRFTVGSTVLRAVGIERLQAIGTDRMLLSGRFQAENGVFRGGVGYVVVDSLGNGVAAAAHADLTSLGGLGSVTVQPNGEMAATCFFPAINRQGWFRMRSDFSPVSDLRIESLGVFPGETQIRLLGQAPEGYSLESSTDLLHWETREVSAEVDWGQIHVEPGRPDELPRFYRARF